MITKGNYNNHKKSKRQQQQNILQQLHNQQHHNCHHQRHHQRQHPRFLPASTTSKNKMLIKALYPFGHNIFFLFTENLLQQLKPNGKHCKEEEKRAQAEKERGAAKQRQFINILTQFQLSIVIVFVVLCCWNIITFAL